MIEKRGKILSFANPKGGVGKSTFKLFSDSNAKME